MHLLLLNNNPAVSRLIKLSVDKVGYELDEFEDYGIVPLNHYDLIMVDNECYDEAELKTLCEQSSCQYILYICQRGAKKPELANASLEKPFLPTDFLALLDKIKNVLASLKTEEKTAAEEEIDLSEDETEEVVQNNLAFDIDGIDTFGIDDESFTQENNFSTEEKELFTDENSLNMPDLEDEDDALDLPTFDLDSQEELPMSFVSNEISDEEDEEGDIFTSEGNMNTNFDSDNEEKEEAFNVTSILDKDEINEVKQLLDENEEESFDLDSAFETSEKELFENESYDEDNDESLLFQDAPLALDEEDELGLDDISKEGSFKDNVDTLVFEETPLSFEDIDESTLDSQINELEDKEIFTPTQEESIDNFEEVIEEKMEEEIMPEADNIMKFTPQMDANAFDSLDDLNENAIKQAFGEVVEDVVHTPIKKNDDVEVIRGEIENTISRSLSNLAQSDILREALKGMRINISITFDEKN